MRFLGFRTPSSDVFQCNQQSPFCPFPQINSKTSWLDGSFIYSTSEAWLNTMRSFENGTFRTDENGMPPKNHERVPIMNKPSPHLFKTLSPERMYCEYLPAGKSHRHFLCIFSSSCRNMV